MKNIFKNKRILVTGGCGTVGNEVVCQLLQYSPAEVLILDNNETEIFFFNERYSNRNCVHAFLGDVRDLDKLEKCMMGIDVVFHAAAFKHVSVCEYNPFDAVQTNILGVQNVVQAAIKQGVGTVIFTSSDKAVNPTNVMGTSKLMGERLITAANNLKMKTKTIFSSTRFGNVAGSKGSVIPIFFRQIKNGGPVTLTDPRMTRFVMTVKEAAQLVLKTAVIAKGGEVIISKMQVLSIEDLAEVMISILSERFGVKKKIPIRTIGAKPGEKLYEELMTQEEAGRSIELKDMFVTLPAFRSFYSKIHYTYTGEKTKKVVKAYVSSSERAMTKKEILDFLVKNRVLDLCEESSE